VTRTSQLVANVADRREVRSTARRRRAAYALGAFALVAGAFGAGPAAAASSPGALDAPTLFIIQFTLLLLFGRLFGEAAQRLGQPAVIGQLLCGIALGPSVLGLLWPQAEAGLFPHSPEQKNMIEAVAQLGVLMLLFVTGMETDVKLIRKVGRAAFSVSVAGIVIPFACGFTLGQLLPDAMLPRADMRLATSLFFGAALSISSVKIVAMVIREMNFMRRDLGQVIVAASIIDDTIGWIIVAIIFAIGERGSIDLVSLGWTVAAVAIFLLIALSFGPRLIAGLIRVVNDNFVSEAPVITAILLVMTIMALITHAIGVNTVLGAFVAGVLVGQSPILTRQIDEQLRGLIVSLFAPVFFGLAGLEADFRIFGDPRSVALVLGFVAIASFGKFLGAGVGGALGGLSARASLATAIAMNARGSTEVIVATIGLTMGALDQKLFTVIVAMAVLTTMAMPPSLRWALARLPIGDEEKARIEREAIEAKGFAANLERFLVVVDDSPSGHLASRLAGSLAGIRQKPITVLEIAGDGAGDQEGVTPSGVTKAAAQLAETSAGEEQPALPTPVTTRSHRDSADKAVAAESGKGYDLLWVGFADATNESGTFSAQASQTAAAFAGSLALALARGVLSKDAQAPLRILAPITGNPASSRAAEIAIAMAQAGSASVAGIYISTTNALWSAPWRSGLASEEAAVLKDFASLADRYGVPARTIVSQNAAIQDAIVGEAQRGGHTLLVLGVSRRGGEDLFFGNVAKDIVSRCPISLLLIST
jgi:Kef-type K+ transport system membrane component KefB/nucleotide-binding universal stress UspA family protein